MTNNKKGIDAAKADFENLRYWYKKSHDREEAHIKADFILVKYVEPEIAYLYTKFKTEVGGFWYS